MAILRHRRCRGLSLIELVYLIVIMGILGALMMPVAFNSLRAYEITRNQVTTLDQVRYALERMAREIREVHFSDIGEASISSATPTQLTFKPRTSTGGAGLDVTLQMSGSNITLAYAALPAAGQPVLLGAVSSLAFQYLDEAQTVMTMGIPPTPDQKAGVHAVRITLTVSTANSQTLTRQTVVQLKNRALL